jgi:hypothetical protein
MQATNGSLSVFREQEFFSLSALAPQAVDGNTNYAPLSLNCLAWFFSLEFPSIRQISNSSFKHTDIARSFSNAEENTRSKLLSSAEIILSQLRTLHFNFGTRLVKTAIAFRALVPDLVKDISNYMNCRGIKSNSADLSVDSLRGSLR